MANRRRTGRPSDAVKAPAKAAKEDVAAASKKPMRQAREVGAQAIYEFRPHLRKVPGDQLAPEKRAPFLNQMDGLTKTLGRAGFTVRAVFKPTRPEDVFGCAKYTGPALSIADMDKAITAEVKRRHARSRRKT